MSRIIGGSHGGRRLVMPTGQQTRPTTDRVREALFAAVESYFGRSGGSATLAGLAVLDLYAGSGALGLEAASRGADPVVLVESAKRVVATSTSRNVAELDVPAQVLTVRAEAFAARTADRAFDLVLADPPYELATPAVEALAGDLLIHGWLAQDGLLVIERSARGAPPTWPGGLQGWSRRYGETELYFASR